MPRQVADSLAREGGSLIVGKVRIGQSGSVRVHDTLLNALSGALLIRCVSVIRLPDRAPWEKTQA
jgi:hypothetical protein